MLGTIAVGQNSPGVKVFRGRDLNVYCAAFGACGKRIPLVVYEYKTGVWKILCDDRAIFRSFRQSCLKIVHATF